MTLTMNDVEAVLPAASTVPQFTVVGPSGKKPVAGEQFTVNGAVTTSVAVGVTYETLAPLRVLPSIVTLPGWTNTGAVVSTTVTVNVLVVKLPLSSVAVHDTRCWPTSNVDPDANVQRTAGSGSAMSVAVAV